MLVGGMFGYTDNKGDFGGPGGGYTLKQPVGTVYAGYGDGPWYVGATLGAGSLDYSDITRVIPLGAALRTESAEARGYELTGRILGGYWFTMKDLMHGPYARLAWEKAVVKQFSENELGQHGADLRQAGAQAAAVEPRLAGRRQHRQHPSLCASHLGDRFEGPGSQRRRVVRHAGRQLQRSLSRSPTTATRCSAWAPAPSSAASPASSRARPPRAGPMATTGRSPSACGCRCSALRNLGTSRPRRGGPLIRIAAACAARARTAHRKSGAAAFAARTRRSPSATAAHRIACGARSRARSVVRPLPHSSTKGIG